MATAKADPSPIEVQAYLRGAHYPMARDDLLKVAEQNGAPDEVMQLLRELPDKQFDGPPDVQKAYREVEERDRGSHHQAHGNAGHAQSTHRKPTSSRSPRGQTGKGKKC